MMMMVMMMMIRDDDDHDDDDDDEEDDAEDDNHGMVIICRFAFFTFLATLVLTCHVHTRRPPKEKQAAALQGEKCAPILQTALTPRRRSKLLGTQFGRHPKTVPTVFETIWIFQRLCQYEHLLNDSGQQTL